MTRTLATSDRTLADFAFQRLRDAVEQAKEDRERRELLSRIRWRYVFPTATFAAGIAAGFILWSF